jgi:hypothetical protein
MRPKIALFPFRFALSASSALALTIERLVLPPQVVELSSGEVGSSVDIAFLRSLDEPLTLNRMAPLTLTKVVDVYLLEGELVLPA